MNSQRMDNILIHPEFHEIKATEYCGVLVLPSTRYSQVKPFRLKSKLRQFMLVPLISAKLIKTTQDSGRNNCRASESGAHREIRIKIKFESKIGINSSKQGLYQPKSSDMT